VVLALAAPHLVEGPGWVKGGCAAPVTDESGVTPTPEVHGRSLPLGLWANNGHWP